MSGKRSGSVRGVLLFEFDTPCKVAHHACVFISGVCAILHFGSRPIVLQHRGDSPAPINVVRGY